MGTRITGSNDQSVSQTKPLSQKDIENRWDDNDVVECDSDCGAKNKPTTHEELLAAYEHWKFHGSMCGCSHAC